jgi:hypothetical protein
MSLSQRLFQIQRALTQDALRPAILAFGGWAPDRAGLANPGTMEALNVIPTADGYRPLKDFSSVSTNSLSARCQGAATFTDKSGNTLIFAGDVSKLYKLTGGAFDDASNGTYATAADGTWEFCKFGDEVIATNYIDAVQGFTVGTDTDFAALITGSNVPKARHVDVVRDFVVLGNTNDGTDGVQPGRVWWSAINNAVNFDPSATTQSDYQDIPEGGWVQRVVGGADYGLIFMETQIVRMSYVGSPLVFRFDPIERRRGTPIPNSVIAFGRLVFFISEEGFFVTDGVTSQPIGEDQVDREFWDNFDASFASRMSAAVDPLSKTVWWCYADTAATGGQPNNIIIYNWAKKKWAHSDLATIEWLLRSRTTGYTLEGLDAISTDLDALPFSLDSRAYTGVDFLGAINTSRVYGTFTGSNLAATLDTGDTQPYPVGLSTITAVRPLVDGGTLTVQTAPRVKLQDTVTFGTAVALDTDGKSNFTTSSRYHRARVNIAAGGTWTHAQGVQIEASSDGVI